MPLLQEEPLRLSDKIASIMAFHTDSLVEKICETVPQICPGKTATYMVDLSRLGHPDDISRDSYGSWGSNSGETYYYNVDTHSKSVQRQNRGRKGKKLADDVTVDMKIRRRFYKHPIAKEFRKCVSIGYVDELLIVPKWAIISYEWLCTPYDFLNKAHGSSKDQ